MTTVASKIRAPVFDVARLREDFPILKEHVHGKPLVYLDNAASAQRPDAVIDAVSEYYRHDHANVHRGVHTLSSRATDAYEAARDKVQHFINAAQRQEIVFVRGTTEAINLVAQSYARPRIGPGDEILITRMEHHSNIVPWQLVCEQTGATLKVAPIDERGALIINEWKALVTGRTRLIAVGHVSNALGTINPLREIIEYAQARAVPVLVDGAQAAPHLAIDVQALGCDFYALSSHKMFGPTGIGALYGRRELLETMPPWQGGGEMILAVSFEGDTWNDLPYKFEAGTPNIAGAVGLGAACDYLLAIGRDRIAAYEHDLLEYATAALTAVPGLKLIGTAADKVAVLSFTLDGVHPHDIGTIVDLEGVAVRTGHHCAMPAMEFFGVPATARASLAFYNTRDEIDVLVAALDKVRATFG